MFKLTPWIACALALFLGCAPASKSTGGGPQRVAIEVTEDGFVPATVTVAHDRPVILAVTRKTDRTCATELVMAEYGIKRDLPLNQTVEIAFTPRQSGSIGYACAMDMYKGKIIAQ